MSATNRPTDEPREAKLAYATREAARRRTEAYARPWARPRVDVLIEDQGRGFAGNVPGDRVAEVVARAEAAWRHPPERAKLAALAPPTNAVATRLKRRQRGWHFEREPGFHDVKGRFEDAARRNPEVKVAATAAALAAHGVDPGHAGAIAAAPDPVKALTRVLREADFGFGAPAKAPRQGLGEFASWGPPSGLAGGGAGDRLGGGAGVDYGGV